MLKLDDDILYYLACNHLKGSPSTIASLSLVSRSLCESFGYVKFRSIKLKVLTSNEQVRNIESPAERLAKRMKEDPNMVKMVASLWFGQEGECGSLPAFEDEESVYAQRERDSICYILTRAYPGLTEVTLSAKWCIIYTDDRPLKCQILPAIWNAFQLCSTLPSLSRVALLTDRVPFSLLRALNPGLGTLAILGGGDFIFEDGHPIEIPRTREEIKCGLHTLEIDNSRAPYQQKSSLRSPFLINTSTLTTLLLKNLSMSANSSMSSLIRTCASTLTTLKIFWHNNHSPYWLDVIRLNKSVALKSLTLALSRHTSGCEARRNMNNLIDALASCIQTHSGLQESNLERINLLFHRGAKERDEKFGNSLFVWLYWIDRETWKHLDDLFCVERMDSCWTKLQMARVGLLYPMSVAERNSVVHNMMRKLPNLSQSGCLDLIVQDSEDPCCPTISGRTINSKFDSMQFCTCVPISTRTKSK
ncbi:hypothetical protein CPB84DRAFT_1851484 [Gymnopilus junonius]|uniref:Uncharacterized protein n=1 Tax=Gymnopilus junonius TaxID=109634 RepID=A0A9P5NG26_GYMJU|nr:hypothetical protein CPB84DRAFT_1851484 [Gymnopilus junonius]